jgi:superfamily I DNA/RNA helicase
MPGEADTTEVVVGTIHSVKGREFDDVLLASCYAPGKRADEDEEARIFYVGITRARNTATVTFADRRIDTRTMAELAGVPSPFIKLAGIPTTESHA